MTVFPSFFFWHIVRHGQFQLNLSPWCHVGKCHRQVFMELLVNSSFVCNQVQWRENIWSWFFNASPIHSFEKVVKHPKPERRLDDKSASSIPENRKSSEVYDRIHPWKMCCHCKIDKDKVYCNNIYVFSFALCPEDEISVATTAVHIYLLDLVTASIRVPSEVTWRLLASSPEMGVTYCIIQNIEALLVLAGTGTRWLLATLASSIYCSKLLVLMYSTVLRCWSWGKLHVSRCWYWGFTVVHLREHCIVLTVQVDCATAYG